MLDNDDTCEYMPHMTYGPSVQLKKRPKKVSVWEFMPGLPEIDDQPFKRLSIDLSEVNYEFIGRLAAYRNVMAAAGKKRISPWTRKALCEAFVAAQVSAVLKNMTEMFAELGELPRADDKEAMVKYVARVIAWDKKTNNQ